MNGRALHSLEACHGKAGADLQAPVPNKMFSTAFAKPFAIIKRRVFA